MMEKFRTWAMQTLEIGILSDSESPVDLFHNAYSWSSGAEQKLLHSIAALYSLIFPTKCQQGIFQEEYSAFKQIHWITTAFRISVAPHDV